MQSIGYSCPILMKLESSTQIFKKNIQISNFMKIHPVGDELLHADRWMDRHDKAKCCFLQFYECA
jgi:hypothetical protein